MVKTPYWGLGGEQMGILGIDRDITERKWMEHIIQARMRLL
jgi:hypothetical protein